MNPNLKAILMNPWTTMFIGALLGALLSSYPVYQEGKDDGRYAGISKANKEWEQKFKNQVEDEVEKTVPLRFTTQLDAKDKSCRQQIDRVEEASIERSSAISRLGEEIKSLHVRYAEQQRAKDESCKQQIHRVQKANIEKDNAISRLGEEIKSLRDRVALERQKLVIFDEYENITQYLGRLLGDLKASSERRNKEAEEQAKKRFYQTLKRLKENHDTYTQLAALYNSTVLELLQKLDAGVQPSTKEIMTFLEDWVKNSELRRKTVQAQAETIRSLPERKLE